jgi:hypothetical protein
MRDPDLVQRAEQAARALEQAWMRWRGRHGLGSGPLPPVSSYVGYSVEEPWGQPRVVLGVEAAEAERLAAILDGHDLARPGQPEPAELPEHRHLAELDPAPADAIPAPQLPPAVQVPPQVAAQSGSLVASPAQSLPATRETPGTSSDAAPTPTGLPGGSDARLKDLALRVTAMRPRPDACDEPQPEPNHTGLAGGSLPVSGQVLAADSADRTRLLPFSHAESAASGRR